MKESGGESKIEREKRKREIDRERGRASERKIGRER